MPKFDTVSVYTCFCDEDLANVEVSSTISVYTFDDTLGRLIVQYLHPKCYIKRIEEM